MFRNFFYCLKNWVQNCNLIGENCLLDAFLFFFIIHAVPLLSAYMHQYLLLNCLCFSWCGANLDSNVLNFLGCKYRLISTIRKPYDSFFFTPSRTFLNESWRLGWTHFNIFKKEAISCSFFIFNHSHSQMDTTRNPSAVSACFFSFVIFRIAAKKFFLWGVFL